MAAVYGTSGASEVLTLRFAGYGVFFKPALVRYCRQHHLRLETNRILGFPHFTEGANVWGTSAELAALIDWLDERFPKFMAGPVLRYDLAAQEAGRNPYAPPSAQLI